MGNITCLNLCPTSFKSRIIVSRTGSSNESSSVSTRKLQLGAYNASTQDLWANFAHFWPDFGVKIAKYSQKIDLKHINRKNTFGTEFPNPFLKIRQNEIISF